MGRCVIKFDFTRIALLKNAPLGFFMPQPRHEQGEAIQLAFAKVLIRDIDVPYEFYTQKIGVEAVLEVTLVIPPPVLLSAELNIFALAV